MYFNTLFIYLIVFPTLTPDIFQSWPYDINSYEIKVANAQKTIIRSNREETESEFYNFMPIAQIWRRLIKK